MIKEKCGICVCKIFTPENKVVQAYIHFWAMCLFMHKNYVAIFSNTIHTALPYLAIYTDDDHIFSYYCLYLILSILYKSTSLCEFETKPSEVVCNIFFIVCNLGYMVVLIRLGSITFNCSWR